MSVCVIRMLGYIFEILENSRPIVLMQNAEFHHETLFILFLCSFIHFALDDVCRFF